MLHPEHFTKTDRQLIIALCVSASIFFVYVCVRNYITRPNSDTTEQTISPSETSHPGNKETAYRTVTDSSLFDPNTVDSVTLVRHGLMPAQVRMLLNFRRKGAIFPNAESLAEVYAFDHTDVEFLRRYIKIDPKFSQVTHKRRTVQKNNKDYTTNKYNNNRKSFVVGNHHDNTADYSYTPQSEARPRVYSEKFQSHTLVDINKADTSTLKKIPGIGSTIAKLIVQQREKLGGFVSISQLKEIKYVSDDLLEWFSISNDQPVHKTNINKASFQELLKHPYISYNQVRDIMSYRHLYGSIKDKQTLRQTNIFSDEELEKLDPYLEY